LDRKHSAARHRIQTATRPPEHGQIDVMRSAEPSEGIELEIGAKIRRIAQAPDTRWASVTPKTMW